MANSTNLLGLRAIVQVDGIEDLARKLATKKDARELLGNWSDTYFSFITSRMRTAGGGQWAALHPRTVKDRSEREARGGKPYKRTSTSILLDTLQLLGAVNKAGGRGQVRRLDVSSFTAECGISGGHLYYDPREGMRTKSGKRRKKPAKRYLGQLAGYHSATGRPIIVPPNKNTLDKMNLATARWFRRLST